MVLILGSFLDYEHTLSVNHNHNAKSTFSYDFLGPNFRGEYFMVMVTAYGQKVDSQDEGFPW